MCFVLLLGMEANLSYESKPIHLKKFDDPKLSLITQDYNCFWSLKCARVFSTNW